MGGSAAAKVPPWTQVYGASVWSKYKVSLTFSPSGCGCCQWHWVLIQYVIKQQELVCVCECMSLPCFYHILLITFYVHHIYEEQIFLFLRRLKGETYGRDRLKLWHTKHCCRLAVETDKCNNDHGGSELYHLRHEMTVVYIQEHFKAAMLDFWLCHILLSNTVCEERKKCDASCNDVALGLPNVQYIYIYIYTRYI